MKQKQIVLMALVVALAINVNATDRYVDLNCPTPISPYLYWTNAANTISAAVAVATSGDTIWVTNGLYSITTQIAVMVDIAIRGVTGPSNTIVARTDGSITTRIFYVNSPGAVLDGLTISNGLALASPGYWYGCGVYMERGLMTNCVFTGNNTVDGGASARRYYGVAAYVKTGEVRNCVFRNNGWCADATWIYGGGVAMFTGVIANCTFGPLNRAATSGAYLWHGTVTHCFFFGNQSSAAATVCLGSSGCLVDNCQIVSNLVEDAPYGFCAALNVQGNDCTVRNCVINRNASGGIGLSSSLRNIVIERCTVDHNSNLSPAVLNCPSGTEVRVRSCLFLGNAGNTSYLSGSGTAGIRILGTNATVENCTIAANYAYCNNLGTGARRVGGAWVDSGAVLRNCIVVSNVAAGVGTPVEYQLVNNVFLGTNHEGIAEFTCSSTDLVHGVNGCITNSPQFVLWPSGYGTSSTTGNLHLAKGSPCINDGTNMSWIYAAYDLDNNRRYYGAHVDMGTYEYPIYGTLLALH
jgi:hypothetical protein